MLIGVAFWHEARLHSHPSNKQLYFGPTSRCSITAIYVHFGGCSKVSPQGSFIYSTVIEIGPMNGRWYKQICMSPCQTTIQELYTVEVAATCISSCHYCATFCHLQMPLSPQN